jgi:hypothetical protein
MQVDRDLSHSVSESVGTQPESAWRTAWRALHSRADLAHGLYVEGWAVTPNGADLFEHGWLEIDGRIVDPMRWDMQLAYFPVLRFDRRQLSEASVDRPNLPVTWRHDSRQRPNPAYRRAWHAAHTLAKSQRSRGTMP